ncbi:MAG: hypothetical protein ABSE05_12025 [Syntrophales bacterium]
MDHQAVQVANLWPLAVCRAAVLLLEATITERSYILGERHTGKATSLERRS